ncbi:MAG: hypothetical protein A2W25_05815 [candidate division Zixibacteria bacterium RBG_16_53_22]|nr:MAG: hypothetical protein A2W25_05815 [candidate division Zixibacteria bacterium RBG_16_53_22]
MPARVFFLTLTVIAADSGVACAMDQTQYAILQESLFMFFSVVCLLLAAIIFSALKGGSLGTPWLFILAGIAVAAVGGAIRLLELFEIVLNQYDLRLAMLVTRVGSVLLFMVGLYLYRKGLR